MKAPTLLIDEADTFLKENDELRGVLNTGHRKGGQITRTVGDDHEPRQFSTWAPAAIAMIGRLPDTLNDRAIAVRLRRRRPIEKVRAFRSDRVGELRVIARKSQDGLRTTGAPSLPPILKPVSCSTGQPIIGVHCWQLQIWLVGNGLALPDLSPNVPRRQSRINPSGRWS
jgi:hypothetical protein